MAATRRHVKQRRAATRTASEPHQLAELGDLSAEIRTRLQECKELCLGIEARIEALENAIIGDLARDLQSKRAAGGAAVRSRSRRSAAPAKVVDSVAWHERRVER